MLALPLVHILPHSSSGKGTLMISQASATVLRTPADHQTSESQHEQVSGVMPPPCLMDDEEVMTPWNTNVSLHLYVLMFVSFTWINEDPDCLTKMLGKNVRIAVWDPSWSCSIFMEQFCTEKVIISSVVWQQNQVTSEESRFPFKS